MSNQQKPSTPNATQPSRVLLVDDNPTNLQVLFQTLDGRGYELLVTNSGEAVLTIAREARPDLILLDIMMPGIDGFETCRRLKSDQATRGIPVIFMSALNETKDKVHGLDLGAVDYITKPFQADEVIARVNTHLTIRRLQQDLARRNADLHEANQRMKRDLLAAAQVQQSMLPAVLPSNDRARFAWHYRPCDELAGDSLGIFSFDDRYIGMYLLDIEGHGVPAALLSVAVTHILSQRNSENAIVTRSDGIAGKSAIASPARVAGQLNRLFPMADYGDRFFTMVYVILDTLEGNFRYASAGHPGPLILRADGSTEALGSTGIPIGIDVEAIFEELQVKVEPGDRIYLYSDGAYEEIKDANELFGVARLQSVLTERRSDPLAETLSCVITALANWKGDDAFSDDVSLVAAQILSLDGGS